MASGPPSALLRRGLISCLHSLTCRDEDAPLLHDQDMRQAMYKLIVGFYDQAYHRLRLPCKAMPDLFGLISTGGFCLGLLDPVSNIILNTLALLNPKDTAADATSSSPPAAKRSKRTRPGFDPWHEVAIRSYHGLTAFLVAYFGCLTEAQAIRYLYRADANLLLAVMLVHHDLYLYAEEEGEEAALDPESNRTKAALEWAANTAGHPSPGTLAKIMTLRLKDGDFALLKKQFSADQHHRTTTLTAEDVRAIHRVLHTMMSLMCVAGISHTKNGLVVHVRRNLEARWSQPTPVSTTTTTEDDATTTTSTAFCWDGTPISSVQFGLLPNKLQDCLRIADGQKHYLKTPCACGDACDYLQSLNMYLLGMIHNLYIRALKLLPTPSGSLMRSILKAGHCYGSMDPVSNIIVNSVWYNSNHGRPLPESDRAKIETYADVFDPLSLLRLQVHSLKGLIELAAFTGPQFSVPACALENLCSAKCDIVNMLPSSSTGRFEDKNPFHAAAMAAGHPLPLQLGELHQLLLLMPVERSKLLALMAEARTSGAVFPLDDIASILDVVLSRSKAPTPVLVQAPELCVEAWRVVSRKRSNYEQRRRWLRSTIERLLKEYTTQHFWGPKYELDIIFGVEQSNQASDPFYDDMLYHVNFTATSDMQLQRTLFFAEFWSYSPDEPRPEFCCPLPYAYAGRCYYDVHSARKIVYPDDAKYVPDDITRFGTGRVGDMLEMDVVYFSSDTDVEVAKNLNYMLPSSKESGSEPEC